MLTGYKTSTFRSAGTICAILFGVCCAGFYNYLLFHCLAEFFSIAVAAIIFSLIWNIRYSLENNYLIFIGIGYLFIAAFDLLHTLSYSGMGVITGYGANLPTQLWIISRYLESATLFSAPFFINRRLNVMGLITAFSVVSIFLLGSIFIWNHFPVCYVDGRGLTYFKKISEYIICLILGLSTILLKKHQASLDRHLFRLLMSSVLVTILSELSFTLYLSPYGLMNKVGHLLKILSFYLIYKAIVETGLKRPYTLLAQQLQKREAALKVSEKRFRLAVDHYPCTFVIYDTERRIQFINKFGIQISGKAENEIIGRLDEEINPPDVTAAYMPLLDRAIATHKTQSEECTIKSPAGTFTFIVTYVPVLDSQGEIIQILGITQDITDQITAKRITENQVARDKAIMNSMKEGLLIVDMETKTVEMNPAAEAMYLTDGRTFKAELLENVSANISFRTLDGDVLPDALRPAKRVLDGETFNKYELSVVPMDGGKVWIASFNGTPIYDRDGKHIFSLLTVRDITEEKEKEKSLTFSRNELEKEVSMRTDQLNQTNKNLEEFVYIASHDLQEPLRKIQTFSDRINTLYGDRLDKRGRDYLARMNSAARRVRALINALLTYSRVSSKKVELKVVDLNKVLHNVVDDLEELVRRRHGRVEIDKLRTIEADEHQMHQLFQNLIQNGLKFNEQDIPTVWVRGIVLQDQEKEADTAERWYRITIEDNGIGMDAAVLDEILKPFQRLHSASAYEGTGIGLAICQKIINRHGGRLKIKSRPGEGSVFSIDLPIRQR